MDLVWQALAALSSLAALGGALAAAWFYRRERPLRPWALALNLVLSAAVLATMSLLAGPGLRPLVAAAALCVGLGIGLLRGLLARLAVREGQVWGRHSPLAALAWGLSLVLAIALGWVDALLAAALGMLALYLSTGVQVALNAVLLVRCLAPRSEEHPPGLPERGG